MIKDYIYLVRNYKNISKIASILMYNINNFIEYCTYHYTLIESIYLFTIINKNRDPETEYIYKLIMCKKFNY